MRLLHRFSFVGTGQQSNRTGKAGDEAAAREIGGGLLHFHQWEHFEVCTTMMGRFFFTFVGSIQTLFKTGFISKPQGEGNVWSFIAGSNQKLLYPQESQSYRHSPKDRETEVAVGRAHCSQNR